MTIRTAYEFFKKITGVTIASDGTVLLSYKKKQLTLQSVADKDFFHFAEEKDLM